MSRYMSFSSLPAGSPWCIESETSDSAIARRNVLLGLWAGRLIGLDGEALAQYARDTFIADLAEHGDGDLIGKLRMDFASRGLAIPDGTIRQRLQEFHREAYRQLLATD